MSKINFGENNWRDSVFYAYTFRYTETAEFKQFADYVEGGANTAHPEGFDNISLLSNERYSTPVRASLTCEFEESGCPEIIIVPEPEKCPDGAIRYGACLEVVLYRDGINVWRHYREAGKCLWHKRLGVKFPVSENEKHTMTVTVRENYLDVGVDEMNFTLRVDDLPESFHMGVTACEGVVRLYDAEFNEMQENAK